MGQEAQACSGTVKLEQCECRPVGEMGGGTMVLWHGTGNWTKCECALNAHCTASFLNDNEAHVNEADMLFFIHFRFF